MRYKTPRAYQFIRPILAANAGWALFITTPRGKNHAFELFQIAQHNPNEWYSLKLTLDDTRHIPPVEIERERAEGIMSEDLIQQEYYCSFTKGVEGSYYQKFVDKMRIENRIGDVPWDSGAKVNVAFDIGVRDSTALIFYQVYGAIIRVIDCYESSKEGLEHYINVMKNKPYTYGKYIAPHDIRVREWGSGITRWDKAKSLGITFTIADKYSIMDGIEKVRSTLSIMYMDQVKCAPLIKALENYRQEYDAKNGVYKSVPLHNFASHYADSLRYLCVSLSKVKDNSDPKELDKRFHEAVLGEESSIPYIFRHRQ
jgi:phage terminase large subunit